jgi:predicted nucleotidyltransferase
MTLKNINLPLTDIQNICERWHIKELALFGSALRSDFHPESDIDLLVTFAPDAKRGLTETLQIQDEFQALLGRKVDLIVKHAIERSDNWLRKKNILESAQTIYVA